MRLLSMTFLVFILACKDPSNKATAIINESIEAHGGNAYNNMHVAFTFRHWDLQLKHDDGKFWYDRTTTDSLNNKIMDQLTNDGFTRKINGATANLDPKDHEKYKDGLNAMAYFALLPYKLSEPAVQLEYLGETVINKKEYYKIGVSFAKDGGGKDHEDEFCYWINKQTKMMDYLSYASGGPRFREATKRIIVDGVTFQDYNNYEIADTTIHPSGYDALFKNGEATLLSTIEQSGYRSLK